MMISLKGHSEYTPSKSNTPKNDTHEYRKGR